jgi:serine/threonine protein phosphatase PrpC
MEKKKETTFGEGSFVEFGHSSFRGMRYTMEDRHNSEADFSFASSKKGSFFGVYDGHGGF